MERLEDAQKELDAAAEALAAATEQRTVPLVDRRATKKTVGINDELASVDRRAGHRGRGTARPTW